MSGGKTLSQSDTKIEALSLQSSAFGVTIPVVYGVNRIAGNLIWYGAFKATPHTTSQSSGKGGGVKTQNTTYTYSASLMMGLCEGQITGVTRIWKGKQLFSGGVLPTQLSTASENYMPSGGGGTYTVSHAATFASTTGVQATIGYGMDSSIVWLAEGVDYTRVGGAYAFGPQWAGVTLTIAYQYVTGGGSQTALQALGLSFAAGALGQAAWSFLATFTPATPPGGATGSQSLGYSGLAYVYAQDYQLGSAATVDNHTFEVQGPQAYSISTTIPDANPVTVTQDLLANGRYGAGFPSAQLGSITAWSNYCLASGILLSPALTEQMQATEFVTLMGQITNTAPVWSSGRLKMIPYGDSNLTGNGATFTADVTPPYDLADDDFITNGTTEPIKVRRKPQADAFNHVQIEFTNRANLYNIEIADAEDSANIDAFGRRSAPILVAHWICDAAVARTVAQLVLQRTLYVRNTFEFEMAWTKVLLEPMNLVTLTDAGLGFNKLPARITKITEAEDGYLAVECEEFPLGVASAALYQNQLAAGFQHDYNALPGSASAPVIFEAPGALTQNGLEIYVAATGTGAAWGGCNVWVSLDGTTYKQIATLQGGSRYGTLSASCGSSGTISVALLTGQLASGTAADAAALNMLAYIGGASPEWLSFQTATLTSALHYDLAGSTVRGAYITAAAAHLSGAPFVRVDSAIARSGPIDLGYVGKTIHVKLTSFNVYGANEESLAGVTDYTYTVTGSQILNNAGNAALAGIGTIANDNILSAGEKPAVILDVANVTNEYAGLIAQASALGVSSMLYAAAYTALVTTYLPSLTTPTLWSDVSGDTTIVGTTFRAIFATYYTRKAALMNAISANLGARSVTRPNMLPNGGFEAGWLGWTLSLAGLAIGDGVWGRQITSATAFSGTGEALRSDPFIVAAGATYTITGDSVMFCTSGDCYFDMLFFDGSMSLLYDGPQAVISGIHDFTNTDSNRDAHAVSAVAPAGAVYAVARFCFSSVVGGTVIGCRMVKVERGGLPATRYTAEVAVTNALTNAAAANAAIAVIADDNVLSRVEKPAIILDVSNITTESAGLVSQATTLGVSHAAYDAAYTALVTTYLPTLTTPVLWSNTAGDTNIVGTTFRSNFAAYYSAKIALQEAISAAAASVGVGGNMLPNPCFINGSTDSWSFGNYLLSGVLSTANRGWGTSYNLNGRETGYMHVVAAYTADGAFCEANAGTCSVVPGHYYQFSILVDLHRCAAVIYCAYLNAAGAIIGYGGAPYAAFSQVPANGARTDTYSVPTTDMSTADVESHYVRLFFTVQPPADTAKVSLAVRLFQGPTSYESYLFMTRAMFCEVSGLNALAAPFDMGAGRWTGGQVAGTPDIGNRAVTDSAILGTGVSSGGIGPPGAYVTVGQGLGPALTTAAGDEFDVSVDINSQQTFWSIPDYCIIEAWLVASPSFGGSTPDISTMHLFQTVSIPSSSSGALKLNFKLKDVYVPGAAVTRYINAEWRITWYNIYGTNIQASKDDDSSCAFTITRRKK